MRWAAGLATMALLADAAAAQEPTLDGHFEAIERRAAQENLATLQAFFGDADIHPAGTFKEALALAEQFSATGIPGYYLPDFSNEANELFWIAHALDALGERPLTEDYGVDVGARACRLVISGGSGGPLFVHLTLLADGVVGFARRMSEETYLLSPSDTDHLDLSNACPRDLGPFEPVARPDDPQDPGFFRLNWMMEVADADGHQVLLTKSPTEGPLREAAETMLAVARLAWSPRDEPSTYFPDTDLDDPGRLDDLGHLLDEEMWAFRGWYERSFDALEQPVLVARAGDPAARVFRLSMLPSFAGPRSITFEPLSDGRGRLTTRWIGEGDRDCLRRSTAIGAIRTSNDLTIECGRLALEMRDLDAADASRLLAWLERDDFWSAPTLETRIPGTDGCRLLVEGVSDGRHHVVDRWACEPDAPSDVAAMLCTNLPVLDEDAFYRYWPPRCDEP